ncbi:MAG: hypothetical protein ACO1NM_06420 [Sphingobium phenoxybenzoativorans]
MLESIDGQGVATALVGLGGFVAAVWAGIKQGLKKAKANEPDPGMRMAAGVLMDNTSMLMLSERLRENTDAMHHQGERMIELAHQMERLRDKL